MFFRSLLSNPIFDYIGDGDFLGLAVYVLTLLLAICIAVSFHEWAHAFVAYKLGDPTAKNMGRMSLDPTKHLTWPGIICFLLFRIGFARPVIVNSRNLKKYRRDDLLISIAGVLMNLLIAFVTFGVYFFLRIYSNTEMQILYDAIAMIYSLNISFAVFNILPIPPLDGYHVLTSIFARKGFKIWNFFNRYGYILFIVLLLTGVLSFVLGAVIDWLTSSFIAFYALFI